jgi:hypothetical protein
MLYQSINGVKEKGSVAALDGPNMLVQSIKVKGRGRG